MPINRPNHGPLRRPLARPYRLAADVQVGDGAIDQLQPLLIKGQHRLGLREVLVFTDTDQIMLSLVGHQGTVNVPLTRKLAAALVQRLTRELV